MREISPRCRENVSCCSPPSSLCTRNNDTVIKAHGCIIKEEEQLRFGFLQVKSSQRWAGRVIAEGTPPCSRLLSFKQYV